MRPGDPETSDTVLSPVLRATAFQRTLDDTTSAGAVKVCGGNRVGLDGEPDPNGLFIEPTVLRVDGFEQADSLPAVRGEKFFPMLSVVVPEDGPDLLDHCLDFLNRNKFGLRNSLWAEDPVVVERFTTEVVNGGLPKVNDSHLASAPYLPGLGGTGDSGGTHGEAACPILGASRLQAVAIATSRVHPHAAVFGSSAAAASEVLPSSTPTAARSVFCSKLEPWRPARSTEVGVELGVGGVRPDEG
ncbi:aldehyde dehydrogenase family protein [Actinosynnema sp. CS-041913]|uniref:aldehyde dehydrogenase family protein n=1 Tax=Actinosynnema sp. CS-041913 TaxID=3239917 RepID=UPI003D92A833